MAITRSLHPRPGSIRISNIVFLYNSERFIGGGEIGFTELLHQAAQEPDLEPLALVPAAGEVSTALESAGIPYEIMPLPSIRGISGLCRWLTGARRLARFCRQHEVSLVHANGARCMLYAGLAARFFTGVPVLWHVRVLDRDGVLDRLRAAWAAVIVCNSRATAETVAPFCHDRTKIRMIHNGVAQEPFINAAATDLHEEFAIPSQRQLVLVAALLADWKGQRDAVRALGLMSESERAKLCIVFAGRELTPGAPFTRELQELARHLGVEDAIVWAGLRHDLPAVMRAANLLLLSSHDEPFGRVIVEAWSAGLPVLATAGGGAGEIIEDGVTGRLIPAKSPASIAAVLPELLNAPEQLAEFAAAGKRRAADFTLEKHAADIFTLYREICDAEKEKDI